MDATASSIANSICWGSPARRSAAYSHRLSKSSTGIAQTKVSDGDSIDSASKASKPRAAPAASAEGSMGASTWYLASNSYTSHMRANVTGGVSQSATVYWAVGVSDVVGANVVEVVLGAVVVGTVVSIVPPSAQAASATTRTAMDRSRTRDRIRVRTAVTVPGDVGGDSTSRSDRSADAADNDRRNVGGSRRRASRTRRWMVGSPWSGRRPLPSGAGRARSAAGRPARDPQTGFRLPGTRHVSGSGQGLE